MTIQIELSQETEERLSLKARAQGMPLEMAAARILEEAVSEGFTSSPNLTLDDFHAMLNSLAEGSEGLPNLPTERFSRESFYKDRG